MGLIILGVLVLAVGGFIIATYNSLVKLRQRCKMQAQIDVQLKRRYDLIPNLVNTVKVMPSTKRRLLKM